VPLFPSFQDTNSYLRRFLTLAGLFLANSLLL
jgi:hypothetical protein